MRIRRLPRLYLWRPPSAGDRPSSRHGSRRVWLRSRGRSGHLGRAPGKRTHGLMPRARHAQTLTLNFGIWEGVLMNWLFSGNTIPAITKIPVFYPQFSKENLCKCSKACRWRTVGNPEGNQRCRITESQKWPWRARNFPEISWGSNIACKDRDQTALPHLIFPHQIVAEWTWGKAITQTFLNY